MPDRIEPDASPPILNIAGEKVALGPRRKSDLPLYHRWINDFDVCRTLSGMRPITWEAEEKWFENASGDAAFAIYERETLRPVGATDLTEIDHRHRSAELGIMIGEKECWGRGYGAEAVRLVLDYGFNGLDLHHVWLRVYRFNERAIRAYEKAGLRHAGCLRESHRANGQACDVLLMDCLATEFESPVMKRYAP